MSAALDVLHEAYVLHARPYRESSQIASMLTRDLGLIGVVLRGIRSPRSSGKTARSGALETRPLSRLKASFGGRGELKNLRRCEVERARQLNGLALYGALYANELLMRLLQRDAPLPDLFDAYDGLLNSLDDLLEDADAMRRLSQLLREFELACLDDLGYGFDWQSYAPEACYRYRAGEGLVMVAERADVETRAELRDAADSDLFLGVTLAAIARRNYSSDQTLRAARRLTRAALSPLLGEKTLFTPKLLRANRSDVATTLSC